MTQKSDQVKTVKKIVVFFDICSSTSILENLLSTENQKRWRDLLIELKDYLQNESSSLKFELYKFLGDGWILLFEPRTNGLEILEFLLDSLPEKFYGLYRRHIERVLTTSIPRIGLTSGMDIGSCTKIVMSRKREYIGRAVNVAARLQGAIGQRDSMPQNKIVLSRNLYETFEDRKRIMRRYKVWGIKRQLKNISGGKDYHCLKVEHRRN
ncbi:MAG: hypothetical protein CEE38_13815 [Planctomycetes bacterium B3_Pla]|nr:MAG: hypothetical protein CEE38_13815 [Planctomycetes bacterium B3_Pla]